MQDKHEDRMTVYEIGYLIASSIPEEKINGEVDAIKKIISDAGASIISEEMPHRQNLAYTIRRKTVAGSYEKYDQAYFGWVKFEVGSGSIEAIKKAIEIVPSIIRMLVTTTVRENTFLGKHAPLIATKISEDGKAVLETAVTPQVDAAPASIEEIDKSIDDMVKEA
ncbi:MAG: 30S ribosomal protein S6 [Candidatus Paceibacterota bacterium]|jgi:ribosomal protein S6